MKRWLPGILIILVISVLVACGNNSEKQHSDHKSSDKPQALKADLKVPSEAKKGETSELSVAVTLGDEKVKDASEVKFEIVKNGDKDHSEMKTAKNNKNGEYTLKYDFKDAGKYNITSHVTARDQHTMPNKNVNVK
ncbi:FixH family protein [Mammaliicoccus sp. Dog046]|uniref:FixH family protein n=1 Tax=Mammaliicoccus sp. Dog046 TaxID=3034233 RepID=UPI002B256D7D|nr:FixH family protein [Mammaliicoccus sp. Dog046]WQK85024.1 FixH family protein [Mammaliicoccus sp. Dog046]